jgi:hypothetical protein
MKKYLNFFFKVNLLYSEEFKQEQSVKQSLAHIVVFHLLFF